MRFVNMVYDDTMTRERMCTEVGFADPAINGVLALYAFSKRPTGPRYAIRRTYRYDGHMGGSLSLNIPTSGYAREQHTFSSSVSDC